MGRAGCKDEGALGFILLLPGEPWLEPLMAQGGGGRKGRGGTALGGELEGFVQPVFVQPSDLEAKKSWWRQQEHSPSARSQARVEGGWAKQGTGGVLTHLLPQPAVPAGAAEREGSGWQLSPLSSV